MKKDVLFLIGPTAAGKSGAALHLAQALNGEIISADSMQVYRGMDIGTAKPSAEEQKKVPHHLIDIAAPSELFDAGKFRSLALQAMEDVHRRGKLPIVVGGSGLYVRALLQGLSGQPGRDTVTRNGLEERISREGLESLYADLERIDPEQAARIKPADAKRIVRALEIFYLSGRKASDWHRQKEGLEDLGWQPRVFGIQKERAALYRAIDRRVDQMLQAGLWQEVRKLETLGLSKTAQEAIGYREILAALKKYPGASYLDLPDAARLQIRDQIAQKTRQFAKRQITWFKGEKNVSWLTREEGESDTEVSRRLLQAFLSTN